MLTDLGLIDTEHQRVEDCGWEVVAVHLAAFMRGNGGRRQCLVDATALRVRVLEQEEEPGGGGRYSLVEERTTFESVLFIKSTDIRLSSAPPLPEVSRGALVVIAIRIHHLCRVLRRVVAARTDHYNARVYIMESLR